MHFPIKDVDDQNYSIIVNWGRWDFLQQNLALRLDLKIVCLKSRAFVTQELDFPNNTGNNSLLIVNRLTISVVLEVTVKKLCSTYIMSVVVGLDPCSLLCVNKFRCFLYLLCL